MNQQHLNHKKAMAPATTDRPRPLRASTLLSTCALAMGAIVACGGGGQANGAPGTGGPAIVLIYA